MFDRRNYTRILLFVLVMLVCGVVLSMSSLSSHQCSADDDCGDICYDSTWCNTGCYTCVKTGATDMNDIPVGRCE